MHELEAWHSTGLWHAADRFIATNLGDHELGPDMIARALRCSRAYLYRLFARRDLTVMGQVQETRLQASHRMLNDPANRLPIADIAHLCGFGDPSSFVRAFRRCFGCLPRDVRVASRQQ